MIVQAFLQYVFWKYAPLDPTSITIYFCLTTLAITSSDFIAGHAHFLLDNFRFMDSFAAKELGDPFVSQYGVHHRWQDDISKYTFFETNADGLYATSRLMVYVLVPSILVPWRLLTSPLEVGAGVGVSLLVVLLGYNFPSYVMSILVPAIIVDEYLFPCPLEFTMICFMWWLSIYCLFTGFTNQFHKWSHDKNPSFLVRTLQALWIVVPPEEHQRHHIDPTKSYCLTTGWCNLLLDKIGYWTILQEWIEGPKV